MVQDRASLRETLYRLRTTARLSRPKLAELSGVSEGQLGNIERGEDQRTGRPPHPKVDTLRRIADGLAFDAETKTTDPAKADRYYRELAVASGYFPAEVATPLDAPKRSPRERVQALLAENPRVATAFEALPSDMDDDDVDALERHLEAFKLMQRRKR